MKVLKNKKIRLIWSILCQSSSIDQETNSVSIFNSVEQLKIKFDIPKDVELRKKLEEGSEKQRLTTPVRVEIITLLQKLDNKKENKSEIEISFIDPKGEELLKQSHPVVIPADKQRFRDRVKFNGLPITESGEYIFKLKIKENGEEDYEELDLLPLQVTIDNILR